ncbi:alpha-mannosidase [Pantanalinema sp. GBBB05]|uniref:alpha-mannosidase n=1 Tax=Pantanalinema sp. GBBB05 TaxID=2604139 RepID=UPI003D81A6E6
MAVILWVATKAFFPVCKFNDSDSSLTAQITSSLEQLRQLTQTSIQAGWRYWDGDLPVAEALRSESWSTWTTAALNARDHLPWNKGRQVRWFAQIITVPTTLQGYPLEDLCLRLALLWWAEVAHVYVNGELVQVGDLFDCAPRLLLSPQVQPGKTIAIALRLVSPNHDDGALMKSVCHYEAAHSDHPLEPSFIANELAVLHSFLTQFAPEHLTELGTTIQQIPWATLHTSPHSRQPFDQALAELRRSLQALAAPIKQRQIKLLGHAHLDMAWLWTVSETWHVAEQTFRSVLSLQPDFPELIFCHSTPALYEWIEQNRPDVFAQIQAQVKAGTWEIVAGFWIEPELNLISGESMVRQLLYGQRYVEEKFGAVCPIAWVPDTFGFSWQLPQILKQAGVEYFVTQKLRWNDTTKFPYDWFWWQAPDGSQILSLMSAPIGEGIDPIKMTNFAWGWEAQTGIPNSLWLPGVGDHGGGPTRDMLEVARRWQHSPFFPEIEFTTALNYLQSLPSSPPSSPTALSSSPTVPLWPSELYLEYHRGCYTTHADQKQWNRHGETLIYTAELWAALATLAIATPYPKAELEQVWKRVLLNQFHDILPGSSITQVFVDAEKDWLAAERLGSEILYGTLQTIAQHINLPNPPHPDARPIVVFNSLNWTRSQVIELPAALNTQVSGIYDSAGQPVALEQTATGEWLFWADQIPAIGYRLFWWHSHNQTSINLPALTVPETFVLENDALRVTVNSETGDLASVWDNLAQREVLSGAGNQLQAFEDKGQYWDAWNIDPNYAQHPLPPTKLQSIQWLERGTLRSRLQVVRQLGNSIFEQDYVLEAGSPCLKIETRVDWQERHILVKAAFPLTVMADVATYEIPCAAIQRSTNPQTDRETAQWEVPALRWVDLSDGEYGVSLLNDCKYGYDSQPSQLRLTLLRGTEWPDSEADKGHHSFTYVLYPHTGTWQAAHTVRQGYDLNLPLQLIVPEEQNETIAPTLPPVSSCLDLGSDSLILMAFKQAESTPEEWVLRCYEADGREAQLQLQSDLKLQLGQPVDLLERAIAAQTSEGQTTMVHPWKIVSFKVVQSEP